MYLEGPPIGVFQSIDYNDWLKRPGQTYKDLTLVNGCAKSWQVLDNTE
jgi:hypothetical protein